MHTPSLHSVSHHNRISRTRARRLGNVPLRNYPGTAFNTHTHFHQKIVIFPIFVIFTVLHTLKIDFFGSAGEIST